MSRDGTYRRKKPRQSTQNKGNLPKNAPPIHVKITHIGGRGDGVGTAQYTHNYQTKEHHVFVADTLPGEEVIAQPTHLSGQGIQATLQELITSASERKEPDCNASPACGGCQFQHMAQDSYQSWKIEQLQSILAKGQIIPASWRTPYFAAPYQRRRARLAYRRRQDDVIIGFRERASHQIIYPEGCTILAPEIMRLVAKLRDDILHPLPNGMVGDIDITLCDNGCDVAIHSEASWPADVHAHLTQQAALCGDITRLCHITKGQEPILLFSTQQPALSWQLPDEATQTSLTLHPAPASFLQADGKAEALMAGDIFAAFASCDMILDLFSGSGALSAALLCRTPAPRKICAYDSGKQALSAYNEIAHKTGRSMQLETSARNLFLAPLTQKELEGFDGVIIDPPRAGASAQMPALAASHIPHIMMVSCNPHSFAKDAAILIKGGYICQWARAIDQFALTAHCEVIAYFYKDVQGEDA